MSDNTNNNGEQNMTTTTTAQRDESALTYRHRCHFTRGADYDAALACICGNELVGEAGR